MKIVLLRIDDSGTAREENGLGTITACLRQAGHEVLLSIINSKNIVLNEIVEFNPKIVGFCAYSSDKDALLKICEKLRCVLKESYICAGGYLPTYHPEELLNESKNIDFVMIGEGEIIWLNLVNSILNNDDYSDVKGVAYRRDNKVIINPRQEPIDDLDKLPYQSRDILARHNIKYAYVAGSRGCKKRCTFCCAQKFWCGWNGKSISKIVDEIQHIIAEYNVYSFKLIDGSFEDSNVHSKNDRVLSFANELLERKLNISYHLNMRAESYKNFSENDMKILKESGLVGLFIGIEAGNQTDLRIYGKSATLKDGIEALNFFERHDIHVDIGFINFHPYSTLNSLIENIDFLEKNNKAAIFYYISSRLMISKGTYLYEKVSGDNLLKGNDYSDLYDYKYVNENIENLARFVSNINKELLEKFNYDRTISYYALNYNFRLENLKRRIKNESVIDVVKTVESNIQNILHTLNLSNSQWFRALIENANNWNEADAIEITNNYFNSNTINRHVAKLQLNNAKLIKGLTRADQDMLFIYENYI